jgi:hypothetical protein
MKKPIFAILIAAAMSACAKAPEDIAATPMQGSYNCEDEVPALAALEAEQRKARTADTIGVIFIGVPVSSLSGGDLEAQIAAAKGRVLACK